MSRPDNCWHATFHPNPCTRFWVILLTDRQTDKWTRANTFTPSFVGGNKAVRKKKQKIQQQIITMAMVTDSRQTLCEMKKRLKSWQETSCKQQHQWDMLVKQGHSRTNLSQHGLSSHSSSLAGTQQVKSIIARSIFTIIITCRHTAGPTCHNTVYLH